MSRVIKLRLGARQARALEQLLLGVATSSSDAAQRATCSRALRQMGCDLAKVIPLVRSSWCTCGHEHDTYTATGLPVPECAYVFCPCLQIAPRPLPAAEEKAALRQRLDRQHADCQAGRLPRVKR